MLILHGDSEVQRCQAGHLQKPLAQPENDEPVVTGLFGTQWWETLIPIAFNIYYNLESIYELE
jgi:hypothetical protein